MASPSLTGSDDLTRRHRPAIRLTILSLLTHSSPRKARPVTTDHPPIAEDIAAETLQQLLNILRADKAYHDTGAEKARTNESRIAHSGMAAGVHVATIRVQQAMGDQQYVAALAGQLQQQHPDQLRAAEDDRALLRGQLALVTTWINNPAYDHTARQALAHDLGLPEPRQEK